jgi:two-component sensor histidine kinase
MAIGRLYDLIDRNDAWANGVELRQVVTEILKPCQTDRVDRLDIDGPDLSLDRNRAVEMALVLNELATNALKYGALRTPDGTVSVRWTRDAQGEMALVWRERGGPPPEPGATPGFGSALLTKLVERSMRGRIEHQLEPDGLVCRITTPSHPSVRVREPVSRPEA